MFPNAVWTDDAPSAVRWAAEIARRLGGALSGRSVAAVARGAGVGRQTIYDVLRGTTWPDVVTIVRLQDELDVVLWPDWGPRISESGAGRTALVAVLSRDDGADLDRAG